MSFLRLSLNPNSNPGADQKRASLILVLFTTQLSGTSFVTPCFHFVLQSTPFKGNDIALCGFANSHCGIMNPGRFGFGFSALRLIADAIVFSLMDLILILIGSFEMEFGLNLILDPFSFAGSLYFP